MADKVENDTNEDVEEDAKQDDAKDLNIDAIT
jgi:hypothetical protein